MTSIEQQDTQVVKIADKIAFMFNWGHGHATQLINFQQCFPVDQLDRAAWVQLHFDGSPDPLAGLRLLPQSVRAARHQLWYARQALARHDHKVALFIASETVQFYEIARRHRAYFYVDLSPTLMRELAPFYDHKLKTGLYCALQLSRKRRLFQAAAGIFTMSEWAATGMSTDYGLPRNRIHVTLPGANLKVSQLVDRSSRPTTQPVRILMVGGQFRLKGGDLLLKWAETTGTTNWEIDIVTWPGELPEWVHTILGRPDHDACVSGSLEPRLPNVRVHCGLKANTLALRTLFKRADVFCLPTQADGSSIASLEAMASGLPVLVTAVGGIPELIQDGKTGLLMKRGDFADLSAKLDGLCADSRLRWCLGRAARESCENYYNVDRQLQEILTVIDSDNHHPLPAF